MQEQIVDNRPPIEFSIDLSADHAARWLFARDGTWPRTPQAGDPLPMSWAVFLRLQPILGVRIHDLLDRDPHRGLYGGVVYRARRPLTVGERLDATATVTDRREIDSPRGRLQVTTLTTVYRDGGEPVLEEAVQMIDLPASPQVPSAPPPASSRTVVSQPPAGPGHMERTGEPAQPNGALPATHDLIAVLASGFDRTRIAWMTAATGDTNPLHLDRHYAARRGFEDVVVPAPLITAWVEQSLSARHANASLSLLELRFQGATLPDQPLSLHEIESAGPGRIELRSGDQVRARGRYAIG